MNAYAWLATHWTTILGLAPWVVGAIFAWSVVRQIRDLR